MKLFTLDREFKKTNVIEQYESAIWTERYYGDSGVEIVVPASSTMRTNLSPGTLLGSEHADEIMILETHEIEDGLCTISGISLLAWLNNRFIRSSTIHQAKTFYSDQWFTSYDPTVGELISTIVSLWCVQSVPFLEPGNSLAMGVADPSRLKIPGLSIDSNGWPLGPVITSMEFPFGPVYDVVKEIAIAYKIGMTITLEDVSENSYSIVFKTYQGVDRTSEQSVNDIIRFSPSMESLTNIKELQSIASYKNIASVWASALTEADTLGFEAGQYDTSNNASGFDLRAVLIFADDITADTSGNPPINLAELLDQKAKDVLNRDYRAIKLVDGEIIQSEQLKFREHFNMGDIVEMQGYTEEINRGRIIEYIWSKDSSGETAYPTFEMID